MNFRFECIFWNLFGRIVQLFFRIFWLVLRPRNKVVIDQIKRAGLDFPVWKYYLHMADFCAEIIILIFASPKFVRSRTKFKNSSYLWDSFSSGGYALCAHLGNWEWMMAAACSDGMPLVTVVKRTKQPWLTNLMTKYRERFGGEILYEQGVGKNIVKALANSKIVGMMLDQYMGPPVGVRVNFFGRGAGTMKGLALLAARTKSPVIPVSCYRTGFLKFEVESFPSVNLELSEDLERDIARNTQVFTSILEEMIRKHPEQWLWMHRRWKENTDPVPELLTAGSRSFS